MRRALRVRMRPPWNLRVLSGGTWLALVKARRVKVAPATVLVATPVIDKGAARLASILFRHDDLSRALLRSDCAVVALP